jgi:uncharacterized radical SAM superfamily Fe-S cluster-containing enzyme
MQTEPQLIHTTEALCPECLAVLPADIVSDAEGVVWMNRSCAEHGDIRTRMWPDVAHYQKMRSLAFPTAPPSGAARRPSDKPCPTGCGICQRHLRKPTLVEIEVTQRCNLHCPVCFMSAEADYTDVPMERLEEFFEAIVKSSGADTGLQLTGGEPTVRADLADIIRRAREWGFWGVEVNTNGLVIARDLDYLNELVDAGLTGIYMQFDGLTEDVYKQVRGAGLLKAKLEAVKNCRKAGIQIVLAMTIVSGINDNQIGAVIDYALANSDVVAGVALQPAFTSGRFDTERVESLTMGDVIFMLEEQTDGLIKVDDILPLGCSHPLCDTGTFLVEGGVDNDDEASAEEGSAGSDGTAAKRFVPITRGLSREEYLALYNPDSPQGSVFGDILAKKGIPTARGLSVIIMNYMDAYSTDLQRLKECSMFVTMADGSLIPFCSYQLTDCHGARVYPPWLMLADEHGAVKWQ